MFIVRIEDVTDSIQAARARRRRRGEGHAGTLVAAATEGPTTMLWCDFLYGNQQFLIVTKTYNDVRLVGAPPSAIGKYGGRHRQLGLAAPHGDFSLFRIYSAPDGAPAEPSADNIPLTPGPPPSGVHARGREGDFTMVFGFPDAPNGTSPPHRYST